MSAFLKGKSKSSKFILPILFGLLAIGLIGFGTNPPSGGRVGSLGKVGDTDIPISTYAQNLRNGLSSISQQLGRQATSEEAQIFGVNANALQAAISSAALDSETSRLNIAANDARVAEEIVNIPGLQGLDGQFDPENYERVLRANGYDVAGFEDQIRAGISRSILESSLIAGLDIPPSYADTMLQYVLEERVIEYTILSADQLAERAGEPSEEELQAFYDENTDNYLSEETRKLTYVVLNQADIAETIEIDEADLQANYEAASDRFNRPAARIVDRLVFSDAEAANSAKSRLDALTITYDQLVEERGLALADVDLGEVIEGDLEDAVNEALFASEILGVIGPLETSLGPALFRINAVISPEVISFENARSDLLAEAQAQAAIREINETFGTIDDLLASGASLEEVANETAMTLGTYDLTATSETGIAAYAEFREAGNRVTTGDFPELLELSDGGLFALRLDEIQEPQIQAIDSIHERVIGDWKAAKDQELLSAEADRIGAVVKTGTSFASLSLNANTINNLQRTSFDTPIPFTMVEELFTLKEGEIAHAANGETRILARLNKINGFDATSEDGAQAQTRVNAQINAQIANDILTQFINHVIARDGVSINQNIVDQVNINVMSGGQTR